jgi:hypothetical protein
MKTVVDMVALEQVFSGWFLFQEISVSFISHS